MGTSSAPSYFPTPLLGGRASDDGGVWANNPVGMAVVEAVGLLGWPTEQLRVLSLGCTATPFAVGVRRRFSLGKLFWASKVVDTFMAWQSSASLGNAYVFARHDNVIRINPVVPAGRFDLDTHKEIKALRGLEESGAREAPPKLRTMFFQEAVEPFIPFFS